MRTEEEVLAYIEAQPWKEALLSNIAAEYSGEPMEVLRELAHSYIDVPSFCFIWAETPQGFSFWRKVDIEYRRWYNREGKEG